MSPKRTPPLHRNVAFEVRYAQKLLYYDRCGSIADHLEAVLGPPFKASVPQMDAAEVKNASEQLIFKFNSTSLIADHRFTSSAIRVVDLIGEAWKAIADRLEVRDRVTRMGMRSYFIIPFDSDEAASTALVEAPWLGGVRSWDRRLGAPLDAGLTVVSQLDAEHAARIAINAIRSTGTPQLFNDVIRDLLPESAVQIDIDVYTVDETIRTVTPTHLKAFAKFAAKSAREMANMLHDKLIGEPS